MQTPTLPSPSKALPPFQEDVAGAELVEDRPRFHGQGLPFVKGNRLGTFLGAQDAQDTFDHLSGHVALFFDLFSQQFLKDIGVCRSPPHEEIAVFLGVLDLGEGRYSLPDQPLGFRRRQGEQCLHKPVSFLVLRVNLADGAAA